MEAARKQWHSIFEERLVAEELEAIHVNPLHLLATWRFILAKKGAEAHDVPDLPSRARILFSTKFKSVTSHVQTQLDSTDGRTTKLLISFQNGLSAEAVIMRHDSSIGKYAGGRRSGACRATLCVSSQVGCKMGCTFCATGRMGFKGNLTSGEIIEQLVHASQITSIKNVVFMGMGEPLNNYAAVVQAVKTMTGRCFCLSPKHITVSTVGIIPKILSLKVDLSDVNLAISLHAPTQELRSEIVPAARGFPLSKLIAAVDAYLVGSKSKVFIEYVMLGTVNDGDAHAHQLGKLLQGRRVVINLIPYNPTTVAMQFKTSEPTDVLRFQKILKEAYGLRTTVRQEMGRDIEGACGQLSVRHTERESRNSSRLGSCVKDIEDLGLDV